MSISASEVNNLRKATGAGLMDCKKALTETNGDFDTAVDYLRKRGAKIAAKRADREATEGAVISMTSDDNKTGVIVLLSCETDFVAKNDGFVAFAKEISQVALNEKPSDLAALKTLNVGSVALESRLLEEVAKIGEKIDVVHYELIEGENVVGYIHAGNRMGVLVEMNNAANEANVAAGKDAAMQIAAMNPVAVDKDGVDSSIVEREMKIGREQAIAEGKPENIIDRIAEGKLQKFYKENTLLNQDFVKDSSMSVAKMLDSVEKGLTIQQFKRVQLG